jgi:hypothetical protein
VKIKCPDCEKFFDDENRWTLCPHNSLDVAADAKYCSRHDLYNCPFCADSEVDARGVTRRTQ